MSIIKFDPQQMERIEEFLDGIPDPEAMTQAQLEEYRQKVEAAIDRLNGLEPKNENSEIYDQWADLHEDLEDILDDILDYLD